MERLLDDGSGGGRWRLRYNWRRKKEKQESAHQIQSARVNNSTSD